MSAVTATFDKLPMTCRTCNHPGAADLRREWGCDGPVKTALFKVECPRCAGFQYDCTRCGGSGEEPVDRCPWATQTREMERVIEYTSLSAVGILPVMGGLEDQSATFAQALKLALYTRGQIATKRAERAAEEEHIGRG